MRELFKYQFINLKRLSTSSFKLLPEYLGLFASIFVFTIILIGLSIDDALIINKIRYLNYNYIIIYFLTVPVFMEGFMKNSYMPNFVYLKLLMPYSKKRILFIDILREVFSFKIIILISFYLVLIPFSFFYNFDFFNLKLNLFFNVLIILAYIIICLIILLIKIFLNNDIAKYYNNYIKVILLIIFVIYTIVINSKELVIDFVKYAQISIITSSLLVLFLLVFIYKKYTLNV